MIFVWESRGAWFNNGGSNTYLGGRNVQTGARAWLIRGKAELISGMGIIRKPDLEVNFGSNKFKVGQIEWEMMTFNGNHWVFPSVPTACPCAKLNEYFAKLLESEIEVPQVQGDFGWNFSPLEVLRRNINDRKVKCGVSKRRLQKWQKRYKIR